MELTAYLPLNDQELGITMQMNNGKLQLTMPLYIVMTSEQLEKLLASSTTGTVKITVKEA